MDSGREKIEIKLDYPIAVETILSVSFNTDGFKMIFDFILDVLRRHEMNLKDHSKSSSNNNSEFLEKFNNLKLLVNDHQEKHELNDSKIESLEKIQLESIENQKSLIERIDSLEKNQASQQEIIKLHESFLKDALTKIDQHQVEVSKLSRVVGIFREDIDKMASQIDNSEKTVANIKEKSDRHSSKLAEHEMRLQSLESDIKQALRAIKNLGGEIEESSKPSENQFATNNYVDSSKLDELSESLKNALKRLAEFETRVKGCEENSNKFKQTLEDALKKLAEFEARVRGCEEISGKAKQISEKLEALTKNNNDEFKRLEEMLRKFESKGPSNANNHESQQSLSKDSFDSLKNSIKQLQELINSKMSPEEFQKLYQELKTKLDDYGIRIATLESNMNKKVSKADLDDIMKLINSKSNVKVEDNTDISKFSALSRRLGSVEDLLKFLVLPEGYDLISITNILIKLQLDAKDLKERLEKNFKDLSIRTKENEDSLQKKAGLDKLKEYEIFFNNQIKESFEDSIKKFADKLETKRALKYLEKLLKDSESIKIIRDGDDAMLARKPLGGWSCASCQKDLEKLKGTIAPYQTWNKLPFRDPADRIARAGPGFSRMLATIQPDQFTNRVKPSVMINQSPPYPNIEEEMYEGVAFPPVKKQAERPFTSL